MLATKLWYRERQWKGGGGEEERFACGASTAAHRHVGTPCPLWLTGLSTVTGPPGSDLLSSLTTGPPVPLDDAHDTSWKTWVSLPGVLLQLKALSWLSLCRDSPSLARLVGLHQSKSTRLQHSLYERDAGLGSSGDSLSASVMPQGLSLILSYILGLREGAEHRCISLQACE